MVLPDPCQQLEAGVLVLVQDEVKEDGGHAFVLEHIARLAHRGGYGRPVAEVVQVDTQLLQHRRLVLHDQDG